jgi:5-methylcytosine-specific restriction protein A
MNNINLDGKLLNELWGLEAKHSLYSKKGDWYYILNDFPGVLFDENGYVLFNTKEEFYSSPHLTITKHLHIPELLHNLPNYNKVSAHGQLHALTYQIVDDKKTTKWVQVNRRIRDTKVCNFVKKLYDYRCQICGETIKLSKSRYYAEGHHIQPLGGNHNGPDIIENILCVCPNHHVLLDYGAIKLSFKDLYIKKDHSIFREFLVYHNDNIYDGS